MRRIVLLALAMSLAVSAAAMAGRITSTKITHFNQVYQVYPATSDFGTGPEAAVFLGYNELGDDVVTAAPGILAIDPGHEPGLPWANYVGAALEGVTYAIKNTTLVKQTPEILQCNDIFPSHRITQQGTPNIRLWWPLMYEVPSTTFTLTILYGTPIAWDDDGDGPNPAAYVHVEEWTWHVTTDLQHLALLLQLFHEVPFGTDEVPLISDETLYADLQFYVNEAITAYDNDDMAAAADALTSFELAVMDACILESPTFPNTSGPGTGIANSLENPACCKLLADTGYILETTGIGMPSK